MIMSSNRGTIWIVPVLANDFGFGRGSIGLGIVVIATLNGVEALGARGWKGQTLEASSEGAYLYQSP